MSTRSNIIVHRADGKWARIYVHWDGYLSHNGRILQDHYKTQEQVEKLIEPGDISILAPSCDKPEGHSFDKPIEGYCVYYGRDRGEEDVAPIVGKTLKAVWPPRNAWTEFVYVWHGGKWSWGHPSGDLTKLRDLDQDLSKKGVKA